MKAILAIVADDIRLTKPLYTTRQAASYLGVSRQTFDYWARGRDHTPPVIHSLTASSKREAVVPFVGLAEGLVVAAFRRSGCSMQYIRKAFGVIKDDIGLEYALASRNLFMHGAQILWNHAAEDAEIRELAEVITKNLVFEPVVADYLKLIRYGDDDLAVEVVLPITSRPIVKANPRRAFGQPVFIRGGARMEDFLDRFEAGDDPQSVAADFDVPLEDALDLLRAFISRAA